MGSPLETAGEECGMGMRREDSNPEKVPEKPGPVPSTFFWAIVASPKFSEELERGVYEFVQVSPKHRTSVPVGSASFWLLFCVNCKINQRLTNTFYKLNLSILSNETNI